MPLRVVLADDEPLARAGLREILQTVPDAEVVAECCDGGEAIEAIRRHGPDVVVLDVQMPRVDGFGVIDAIGADRMPGVVFVTAYDEYACRAFDVAAVGYVLKPVDPEKLREAFARAARVRDLAALERWRDAMASLLGRAVEGSPAWPPAPVVDRLAVRVRDRIEFVEAGDIDWMEAEGNYVRIHCAGQSHLIRQTLGALHRQLGVASFVRVRRSLVVRIRAIRACEPLVKGSFVLILRDGTRLTSSRHFRDALRPLLGS